MGKIIRLLASWALMLTMVFSCQRAPQINSSPTGDGPADIWDTWIPGACRPPCWQDITPGETPMSEAISILQKMPAVMIKFRDEHNVVWQYIDNKEGGEIRASENGIVSSISLSSILDNGLRLDEVVEAFGSPQYVKPYDCRLGMCVTALIYEDLGMFLSVFVPNMAKDSDPKIEIRPSTTVNKVYFVKKGIENFKDIMDLQADIPTMEWKGYVKYP